MSEDYDYQRLLNIERFSGVKPKSSAASAELVVALLVPLHEQFDVPSFRLLEEQVCKEFL